MGPHNFHKAVKFHSRSQSGQDKFAHDTLVIGLGVMIGKFLDIGSGHPIDKNNTYSLERMGWEGLLVDSDAHCAVLCNEARTSYCLNADAVTINWTEVLAYHDLPKTFDYLSLDVDGATQHALKNLLDHGVSWKCATVETDLYRLGPEPRANIRKMMHAAGYKIAVADVEDQGLAYEDFWVRA